MAEGDRGHQGHGRPSPQKAAALRAVEDFVLSKEAVEAHEADLDALVQAGKRRRTEQGYASSSCSGFSTTAGSSGAGSDTASQTTTSLEADMAGDIMDATGSANSDGRHEEELEHTERGYTEAQWELWNLRREVERLHAENERMRGAARPMQVDGPPDHESCASLPLLDTYAAAPLVFATDFLVRAGYLERTIFEQYTWKSCGRWRQTWPTHT